MFQNSALYQQPHAYIDESWVALQVLYLTYLFIYIYFYFKIKKFF